MVIKCLNKNILSRFGVPKAIISNRVGFHFCNRAFKNLLKKYHVIDKISTPYHQESNGQAKLSNMEIEKILGKMINSAY